VGHRRLRDHGDRVDRRNCRDRKGCRNLGKVLLADRLETGKSGAESMVGREMKSNPGVTNGEIGAGSFIRDLQEKRG